MCKLNFLLYAHDCKWSKNYQESHEKICNVDWQIISYPDPTKNRYYNGTVRIPNVLLRKSFIL